MNLQLAINTSEKRGQLVILENHQIKESIFWEGENSHSEVLTAEFEKVLGTSLKADSFNKIYCVTGPGSFTGLRVGVSFCKTLGFLNRTSIYPVNTLDLLALNCEKKDRTIFSLIDAQKNSVFFSSYIWKNDRLVSIDKNKVSEISKLNKTIRESSYICGQGLSKYKKFLDPTFLSILEENSAWEKSDLTRLFLNSDLLDSLLPISWDQVKPLYIKASAPEEKLKLNSQ